MSDKSRSSANGSEAIQVQCLKCKHDTNHTIVAEHLVKFESEELSVWHEYAIAVCRGCDSISFVHTHSCSEDFDPNTGDARPGVILYPDRASGRTPIQGDEHFPTRTRKIYSEVIKAMNSSSPLLAAIGLRALIESICLDQQAKGKVLKERIDALATLGLLSKRQADILHNHRFMGNIAAHEVESAPPQELVAALEIAETLLKTIYVLTRWMPQSKRAKTRHRRARSLNCPCTKASRQPCRLLVRYSLRSSRGLITIDADQATVAHAGQY